MRFHRVLFAALILGSLLLIARRAAPIALLVLVVVFVVMSLVDRARRAKSRPPRR